MSANADGSRDSASTAAGARSRPPATPARAPLSLLIAAALLPAALAVIHAANVSDAAHDEAVVRALGMGWTGAWRALDAPWCGLFAWLPLGTRAFRASLASATACGLAGGALFVAARAALMRRSGAGPMASGVALLASLAAGLSPPWQIEGLAPAGTTLGGLLTLAPLALLVSSSGLEAAPLPLAGLFIGLAASYDPTCGAAAALSALAYITMAAAADRRAALTRRTALAVAASALIGAAPFALAFARRASTLALAAGAFAASAGERAASTRGSLVSFLHDDVGLASCLFAIAGGALAVAEPKSRPAAAGFATLACAGAISMALGAPAGPTRYGPVVLAGICATYALAAVAMHAAAVVVSRARVPFAKASAAMVLVLEGALPARAADDATARSEDRARPATATWNDVAWGSLPAGAEILIRDPAVLVRLDAARASGELRADLGLLPLFDLGGRGALLELARDPKLEPIWRDAALLGRIEEWSLSSIASERPLVAAYDPGWDRTLARHLVPAGLLARFEPEPRGASERRRALDDFSPAAPAVPEHPGSPGAPLAPSAPAPRERLARAIDGDPELLGLTARLLRARAIALAAASERDVVAHALDDLRPFSARDAVATELARRMALSRGAIDVHDLAP